LTHYEKRFARATLDLPRRNPADAAEREEILRSLRASLGVREEWLPEVKILGQGEERAHGGYRVQRLRATTWPGCHTAAHLYLPEREGVVPLVLIVCGHAAGGEQAES